MIQTEPSFFIWWQRLPGLRGIVNLDFFVFFADFCDGFEGPMG